MLLRTSDAGTNDTKSVALVANKVSQHNYMKAILQKKKKNMKKYPYELGHRRKQNVPSVEFSVEFLFGTKAISFSTKQKSMRI